MGDPLEDEWRELGFYCHHSSSRREYRLVGPRSGLLRFVEWLRAYVRDPRIELQSEHAHYGAWSLEVMTWPEAGMDDHAIHGPLPKLAELADLVERRLTGAVPGQQVRIRAEFTPSAEFTLVLDVRRDDFDPPAAANETYDSAG